VRPAGGRSHAFVTTLVSSIARHAHDANCEILVIDDGRLPAETVAALAATPHRRVSVPRTGPFNFAAAINAGAREAKGDHLLLLNDDVEVRSSGWLDALVEYSQDEGVGAVGGRLVYPDGRLQHIGIVLGVNAVAAHAFHQAPGSSAGYFGSAVGPRNYSALTAACLMTRAAVFQQAGGFNERLPVDFNDVDYCLRLRAAGYRIVFTPHAELTHHESASLGARSWDPAGVEYMRRTWASVIAADPFYNVNLTRDHSDYRLGT
jgi:GT2 family glycosyltransferase